MWEDLSLGGDGAGGGAGVTLELCWMLAYGFTLRLRNQLYIK